MKKYIIKCIVICSLISLFIIIIYFVISLVGIKVFNQTGVFGNAPEYVKIIIGLAALSTGISVISTYSVFNAIVEKNKSDKNDINDLGEKLQKAKDHFNTSIENGLKELNSKLYKEINKLQKDINKIDFNIVSDSQDAYKFLLFNYERDVLLLKILSPNLPIGDKYAAIIQISNFLIKNEEKTKENRLDLKYLIDALNNYYETNKNNKTIKNEAFFLYIHSILLREQNKPKL